MARYDVTALEESAFAGTAGGEIFVRLGLMYSTGGEVPTDRVAAHKWFNIAASKGNRDGIELRREIAQEMSEAEVAAAQRAAREWLTTH
jgi:TPR repeat protein